MRRTLIEDLWNVLALDARIEEQKLALRRFRHREMPPHRLQRHRPRPAAGGHHRGPLAPCRRLRRGGGRGSRARRAEARHGDPRRGRTASPPDSWSWGWASSAAPELNYSSDIDLIFLYEEEGRRPARRPSRTPSSSRGWGARSSGSWPTTLDSAWPTVSTCDCAPKANREPLARSFDATIGYYVTAGRTWERQALIKCRPIAGRPRPSAATFIEAITPFVYRRYLGAAEIAEIKAMKRRIEQRTVSAGADRVRGQDRPRRHPRRRVRRPVPPAPARRRSTPRSAARNTLLAIDRLEQVGCLDRRGTRASWTTRIGSSARSSTGFRSCSTARRTKCPATSEALRTLAIRMGYAPASPGRPDRPGPPLPRRLPEQDRAESPDP